MAHNAMTTIAPPKSGDRGSSPRSCACCKRLAVGSSVFSCPSSSAMALALPQQTSANIGFCHAPQLRHSLADDGHENEQ